MSSQEEPPSQSQPAAGKKQRGNDANGSAAAAPPAASSSSSSDNDDDNGVQRSKLYLDRTQSQRARQKIRQQYRAINVRVREHHDEMADLQRQDFANTVDEVNNLNKGVTHNTEALADAKTVSKLSQIGVIQAQQMMKLDLFRVNDFLSQVAKKFADDDGSLDWPTLGRMVDCSFRGVPCVSFMYGSLQQPERKRKERRVQQRRRDDVDDVIEVAEAEVNEGASSAETHGRVQRLAALLSKHTDDGDKQPVNLFKFIVNPHSFTETVENIFDLSFLVKRQTAQITLVDDVPFVNNHRPSTSSEHKTGVAVSNAFVFAIDQRMWRKIVDKYNIKESIVPTRFGARARGGSQDDDDDEDDDEEEEVEEEDGGGDGGGGGRRRKRPQKKQPAASSAPAKKKNKRRAAGAAAASDQ